MSKQLGEHEEPANLPLLKPGFDTVVVRFGGEMGIKADWTRKLYERRLMANIKAVMKKYDVPYTQFVRRFGRLYIKTVQAEEVAERLSRVFGVSSLSPAVETTSDLDDILSVSVYLAGLRFKEGKTFAVHCRRVGKHSFTSQDVCRQVGHAILTQLPRLSLKVDLTRPEQTLFVEVREDKAYVFSDKVKGVGGLPLGTQPKLVCLLKGDVSSAVACWMTMKRGCPPIMVHFRDEASTRRLGVEKMVDVAKMLMEWSVGFPRKLYVIKSDENFFRFAQEYSVELGSFLCKRLMLRVAQGVARMKNAEGIVLGDTIEKEANKTLHAFRMQDEAVQSFPIYRPLLGLGLHEIEEIAQKIGLEKASLLDVKSKAESKVIKKATIKLRDIKRIEKELNIEKIVEGALKSIKVLEV